MSEQAQLAAAVQQQCSSAAGEGWRFCPPMPSCLDIGGHPSGPRQGHSTLWAEYQEGCGWPVLDQTGDTGQTFFDFLFIFFILSFFSHSFLTKVFEFAKLIWRPQRSQQSLRAVRPGSPRDTRLRRQSRVYLGRWTSSTPSLLERRHRDMWSCSTSWYQKDWNQTASGNDGASEGYTGWSRRDIRGTCSSNKADHTETWEDTKDKFLQIALADSGSCKRYQAARKGV